MRPEEQEAMERLVSLHPPLHGATIGDGDDPPDAIIVHANLKLGFELTAIHAQGEPTDAGNSAVKYRAHWQKLRALILSAITGVDATLDEFEVLATFRKTATPFDTGALPHKTKWTAFAESVRDAILQQRDRYVAAPVNAVVALDTSGTPLLERHLSRLELRRVYASTKPNVVDASLDIGYVSTSVPELEAALVAKAYVNDEPRRKIANAGLDEYYLVLGGRDPRSLVDMQPLERQVLELRLPFLRVPFEAIHFDGIILFDMFNGTVEVFCCQCLAKLQKDSRVGVGVLDFWSPTLFDREHDCPSLVLPQYRRQ